MKDTTAIHLSCSSNRSEFWENLQRHSGTGTPVVLPGLDTLNPADANRLVQFFLHDPTVTSPIQPLADLLAAMIQKRELSLWDIYPVEAGTEESQDAFLRALPRDQPACLACACFPVCQGYGVWAVSCETWLTLLTGIAVAARSLSRLRAQNATRSTSQESHVLPTQS